MPAIDWTSGRLPIALLSIMVASIHPVIAAPLRVPHFLQARANPKDDSSDSADSKDAKSSDSADPGSTKAKLSQYSNYAIGGMPLYIWLLIVTGAMIVCFGIFWWWRTQKKIKKEAEESKVKAEEEEKEAEMERQNAGVPNPEEEFEGDDNETMVDGYSNEKMNPDFLQVQNQQHY